MPSKTKKDSSIVPRDTIYKPTFPKSKIDKSSSNGFPIAQYTSIVGTKSVLLLFTALFLPKSSTYFFGPGFLEEKRLKKTSLDRPEHPFMVELTDWPEVTMTWVCLGTMLVVPWWAGYVREWRKAELRRFEESYGKEKKELPPTFTPPTVGPTSEKIQGLKDACLATACGIPCIFFLIVLFGAPFTSNLVSTTLLSTLLATLLIYTPIYALGPPSLLGSDAKDVLGRMTYTRLFSEFSPRSSLENALVYPVLGSIFGCGIGAFPIPLDWDRPWQAWPLTPAFGAILGYILGSICSVVSASTSPDTFDKAQ